MSKIQYLIENVDASQFYLIEHVVGNAIQNFCENVNINQCNLINQYVDLLSQSKMDLALESKLSKEILPYLEAYVDIYSPFIFQNIEESESEFSLADYRSKVGKDVVAQIFENMMPNPGQVIAKAIHTVWGINNLDGLHQAIDNIFQNTDLSQDDIINWIKSIIKSSDNPDAAVTHIITVSTKPDQVKQLISQSSAPKSDEMLNKFDQVLNQSSAESSKELDKDEDDNNVG